MRRRHCAFAVRESLVMAFADLFRAISVLFFAALLFMPLVRRVATGGAAWEAEAPEMVEAGRDSGEANTTRPRERARDAVATPATLGIRVRNAEPDAVV